MAELVRRSVQPSRRERLRLEPNLTSPVIAGWVIAAQLGAFYRLNRVSEGDFAVVQAIAEFLDATPYKPRTTVAHVMYEGYPRPLRLESFGSCTVVDPKTRGETSEVRAPLSCDFARFSTYLPLAGGMEIPRAAHDLHVVYVRRVGGRGLWMPANTNTNGEPDFVRTGPNVTSHANDDTFDAKVLGAYPFVTHERTIFFF